MITKHQAISLLRSESDPVFQELSSLLENGTTAWPDTIPEPVNCSEIYGIYKKRSKHLASFSTPFAKQLKHSLDLFLHRLSVLTLSECRLYFFLRADGFVYTLVVGADEDHLLGCMKSADQRILSQEEWSHLWE